MKRLKALFSPPVFPDEVKTQQAYLLNIILWVLISVPIPFVLYTLTLAPETLNRALIQATFGETANIVLLWMLHRGFVRAASIAQVGAFWFFFTVTALTGTGVQGEAYLLGYSVVIAIAGMLLGGRGALVITVLSLVTGALMVYKSGQGLLHTGFASTPFGTWVVSLVLFPVSATLQYLGTRITRQALSRARASEERYRLISAVSSDYTFSTKLNEQSEMYLNWVDGAFERMTGYTFEEYVASGGWRGHIHPDDMELDDQALAKLTANQSAISEVRTFKKNREIIWVRVYANPVWDEKHQRLIGIVGAVQDINEQKQAEEALRRSESIYRRAIEVAGAVPYHQTFDTEGRIHYDFMGEGIRQITGYGPEEFTDDLWGTMVIDRHLLEALEPYSLEDAIEQVRTGNIPIWKCEHRIKARDGKIRWVFEAAVDLRGDDNIAYGSVGLYQDITDRKQSEDLLKYERDLLQIFLDNIPDTVYFKDAESRFVRINSAQARMLEISSPQDAIGKTDLDFLPPERAKPFMEEERKIIQTGEPVVNRIEFNPTHDGELRWLSATKVPVKDTSGKMIGVIGISRDVTEQKLAQEHEQNRRAILEKVLRLGQEVTEMHDLNATLKRIWHGVRHDLNFDRVGIFLYDPEHNSVDGTYGTNRQGELSEEWNLHISLNSDSTEALSFLNVIHEERGLYFTHNFAAEQNIPEGHIMYGVKDYASFAAWAGDIPVGVISVDNLITGRLITNEQLEALRLFAGYAGLAIENSRLNSALQIELQQQKQAEEQEMRRRSMLEKVLELGKQVTETADLNTTLKRIWHGVHQDLNFDRLGIYLYNPGTNSMDGTFGTNSHGEVIEEWSSHIRLDDKTTEADAFVRVLRGTDGLYFTRSYDAEHNVQDVPIMQGVKDFAAVAARVGDKPVAVICVDQSISGGIISEEQLEALRLFAGYAGLAIENSRLNDALQIELQQQKQAEEQEMRRRAMLEKVLELGKQVTETTDINTTLQRIWHGIHDDLGFDRLGVFLYNENRNSMDSMIGTDIHGDMEDTVGNWFPISEWSNFSVVLEKPDGLFFTHNYDEENNIQPGHEMYGVKDYAAVAAWAGNKPVAVISVDQVVSKRRITSEQLEALRLFAGYAGLAIQNARLNDALEDDLAHRQTLIDELEAKNAELERFTYTVSHDLKSPLVTITGFLGYVEKDALAGDTVRVKSSIERILRAAQKMQTLLNDLLELSRIGRLMNEPENILFKDIVSEALDHVRGRLEANNVRVEVQDSLPTVHGDKIRLIEVVQNLLDNAAKFSKDCPDPLIKVGSNGVTEKGMPIFFVCDNGIGIAPKYHEKIFGLFDKLDPTVEGTGVGLALVKRIVEVHGGKIWLESQPGVGTTFYFTLPGISLEE